MRSHGIMFHHFHGNGHPVGQGSISADQLAGMIEYLGRERILSANEWIMRLREGRLKPDEICLTFDDNLRCQYDIAFPVLESFNIKAFWFVYTSAMLGGIERLEVYRYFRSTVFPTVEDFYSEFFAAISDSPFNDEYRSELTRYDIDSYLSEYPMYTWLDRKFRLTRDAILGETRYNEVMDALMARHNFDAQKVAHLLWMDNACIKNLAKAGHIVGLHSHTHPTTLGRLSEEQQWREYSQNVDHLKKTLGIPPVSMSHPCNSYSPATLRILSELGIEIGFRANMLESSDYGPLELPRTNHMEVIGRMEVLRESSGLYVQPSTPSLTGHQAG